MKAFKVCEAYAAPLLRGNIDTDLIIRIERIAQLKRGQFAPWAFEAIRYHEDGTENLDFILNRPPFREAGILISGSNFGCGSSREMAVWALEEYGIRCVIAESYGDIFYGNCLQNGVLPIKLLRDQVERLAQVAATGVMLKVDLETCIISAPTIGVMSFDFPEPQREMLLQGLDEIDLTLKMGNEIEAFQARVRQERPWVFFA